MNDQSPFGPYAKQLADQIEAVKIAAASRQGKEVTAAREVHSRSFLERHNHEAGQLRKLIEAMLDTDESACGDSPFLVESRATFRRLFDIEKLPDPTHNGFRHLAADDWEGKFESSLRRFYHHLSEKHDGELIEVSRTDLPKCFAEHPAHEDSNEWLPEAHSPQFFADDDLPKDVRARGISFFKNKWWRQEAASGAKNARDKFIYDMWDYPNAVWAPVENSHHSKMFNITFHSLDSLVWEAAQRLPYEHGGDKVNFGDLYGRLP